MAELTNREKALIAANIIWSCLYVMRGDPEARHAIMECLPKMLCADMNISMEELLKARDDANALFTGLLKKIMPEFEKLVVEMTAEDKI